jgi:DNA-binding transcriptional LysR family regulator
MESASARTLATYGMIIREPGSGTRAALEQYLRAHAIEPRIEMEMASNETIKQAVMAGMGLGFLSLHTIGLELDNRLLVVLDIEGSPVVRAWNVVHTLSKLLSPAAEALRYFILERGEQFLADQFGRHVSLDGVILPE